jgi:PAS domain S-box-containing protein
VASEKLASTLPNRVLLQLLDEAPDALILVDEAGLLRFANREAENMFGYPRSELLGQPLELLVPAALRAGHAAHRASYMRAPVVRSMGRGLELSAQTKTGLQFPVEISLSPVSTGEGNFVASSIRDITERKRYQDAVTLTGQRLRSAVETIQSGFALFDADDRLLLCNSEFRQLFGDASGPVIGRSFAGLLADNRGRFGAGEHADQVQGWLAYHSAPQGTLDVRTNDQRTLRVAELRTPEGGRVMTLWDISADVARELALERAQAAAQAANAAKSEFLSSMSHELRTPLNAILGFAQLVSRDKLEPPTPRQRERLEHVLRGGEHLLRLIDDVLDLSRVETGRLSVSLEPVSVQKVMRDAVHAIEPMAVRHDIQLHSELAANGEPEVRADRTRLAQVLINFGSNAVKYGNAGGNVRFRVELHEDARVRLIVDDDGPGIPLEQQDKLFQPFQRAGQELGNVEGTGIGLALCKRLAEAMSGRVGFASAPGQGSSFWIELPLVQSARDRATSPAPQAPDSAQPAGRKHSVLYVEDNPSNVALMRHLMLDYERVELSVAASAEAGIAQARQLVPSLIIMDINLPGLNGIEAAQELKRLPETRHIPIIALSAAAMSRDQERGRETPFHRYLTKPVKMDVLLQTIEPLLPP